MNQKQIEYYHNTGKMPDWVYYQVNGKSAAENLFEQRKKFYREIEEREAAKAREEAKKKIEQQILDAIVLTLQQGEELVANAAADDIIASVEAAVGNGTIPRKKMSFSQELGFILGKALGEAPFKLLDEMFDDDKRRR